MYEHLNSILNVCTKGLFSKGTVSKQMWSQESCTRQVTGTLKGSSETRFTVTVTEFLIDMAGVSPVMIQLRNPRSLFEEPYRISVDLPLDETALEAAVEVALTSLMDAPNVEADLDTSYLLRNE